MSVGPTEILLIAIVVFLLFGTRRLGDLGKGIGEGIRNFKIGISGSDEKSEPLPPKQIQGNDPPSPIEGQKSDEVKVEKKHDA
jgi:sec-independent protein translocase protein TatA